jgi:hypothetical protein
MELNVEGIQVLRGGLRRAGYGHGGHESNQGIDEKAIHRDLFGVIQSLHRSFAGELEDWNADGQALWVKN